MNDLPRLLERLLAEDGRPAEMFKPGDCPAPFHAEIAKLRAAEPSFRFDARGIGECSTCGFRGGALEYLLVARRLPLEAAREELARVGASQAWIEKACRRHALNVAILAAFADALQRNPDRRHVLSADAVRWYRAKLERDGRAFDADGKHVADHLRPFGLRPAILRVRKRSEPPPHMQRGYRRNDVLRAATRAGLPESVRT